MQKKPIKQIQERVVETLLRIVPRPVATNFRYIPQEDDFQYDDVPSITLLSIATGEGDFDYDIIKDFRSKSKIPITLIIIDPIYNIEDYARFRPYVQNLYVNPQQDGFSKLLSEENEIPTKYFKLFDRLLKTNLSHPDVVVGSNLQWGLPRSSMVSRPGQRPIQLDYRSPQFQRNLQGFRPFGKDTWIKPIHQTVHSISQSSLRNLLNNRKIWRFYENIQDRASIPAFIISNTMISTQGEKLYVQGITNRRQTRPIRTFQDLLEFFASARAIQ